MLVKLDMISVTLLITKILIMPLASYKYKILQLLKVGDPETDPDSLSNMIFKKLIKRCS